MDYRIGACELTAGELSTRGTPEIRAKEAARAAEIMGLQIRINLNIPDGNIEESFENKLKVIKVLRKFRPRFVFLSYWKCRHYDHVHASYVVAEACHYSGLKKIDTDQEPFRPDFLFFYPMRHEFEPSFIVDVTDHFERKMEAIQAHKSQFYDPKAKEPDTFISSRYFLDSIVNRMRYYGARIGVEYAEPLLVRESIMIDDPFELFGKMDAQQVKITRDPR
jgi:bacillithiol biosynthesis deacetylase BshB1